MANSNDVLKAIGQVEAKVDKLMDRLYSKNGFEGDIPEIKNSVKEHDKRISRNSRLLFTALGILSASGLGFGMASWLG